MLWLDNLYAAKFNGTVSWLDIVEEFHLLKNYQFQVHIELGLSTGHSAVETVVDVLTDADERFSRSSSYS